MPASNREELIQWFIAHQRPLPWRFGIRELDAGDLLREPGPGHNPIRDPYRTWIAEIMLQQTQVVTVVDYYNRWMIRFPDVKTLAEAREEEVLAMWAGLGYYSRARNLLSSARWILERHGGLFPDTKEDLLKLKGVGDYTAGAILSLAFNQPEPILDGNLVRVFSRFYGWDFLPFSRDQKKVYWGKAAAWANGPQPGRVNEALMELGALICLPNSPKCEICPIHKGCHAFRGGLQEVLPPVKSRPATRAIGGFALVARSPEHVLLHRPIKPDLLAGLLTFPILELEAEKTESMSISRLEKAWSTRFSAFPMPPLEILKTEISHSITRHRIRLRIVRIDMGPEFQDLPLPASYGWYPVQAMDELLVSSLPIKIWRQAVAMAPTPI